MAKNLKLNTKVAVPSEKPAMGVKVSQPIKGKLGGSVSAMPGSEGKGQAVKTVKSNPIQGKTVQPGNSSMGSGGVIDPFA